MEKILDIIKIVLLVVLIAVIIGIAVIFMNKDLKFGIKTELIYDEIIKEEFNKIEIKSKSLDYEFVKSNNEEVNIKIYDAKDHNPIVKVEAETLKIETTEDFSCMFCFNIKRKVIISLPEDQYDLIVDATSGDLKSEIDFNNVKVSATSGDYKFQNIKDATINVSSGDITLDKVEKLEIKSTSGDIKISEVDEFKAESTSGDIEVEKINNHIDLKTTSGDIEIKNLTLTNNSSINAKSGDIIVYNASEGIYYNTKVKSGDVKINNNDRYAEIELTINTTSGDIIIKN